MARKPKEERDAAAAVVIEEANVPQAGPVEGLTRDHLEYLRQIDTTRAEVRELAVELFGGQRDKRGLLVDRLMDDLDSYGPWAGDPEET